MTVALTTARAANLVPVITAQRPPHTGRVIDLDTTADVKSFRGPWPDAAAGRDAEEAFHHMTDDEPEVEITGLSYRLPAFDMIGCHCIDPAAAVGGDAAVARLNRLLQRAPQMFAALKIARKDAMGAKLDMLDALIGQIDPSDAEEPATPITEAEVLAISDRILAVEQKTAFRHLDWIARTWIPAWLTHCAGAVVAPGAYPLDEAADVAKELRSHPAFEACSDLLDLAGSLEFLHQITDNAEPDRVDGDFVAIVVAMELSGWTAAIAGAEIDVDCPLNGIGYALFDSLFFAVRRIVVMSGRRDFDELTASLQVSAAMLAELGDVA